MSADPLVRRFAFHPVSDDEAGRSRALAHERLRAAGLAFAQLVHDILPEGRELDRAIDAIDDAVMLANAGLARPADPALRSMSVGPIAAGRLRFYSNCPPHEAHPSLCNCVNGNCAREGRCVCAWSVP